MRPIELPERIVLGSLLTSSAALSALTLASSSARFAAAGRVAGFVISVGTLVYFAAQTFKKTGASAAVTQSDIDARGNEKPVLSPRSENADKVT